VRRNIGSEEKRSGIQIIPKENNLNSRFKNTSIAIFKEIQNLQKKARRKLLQRREKKVAKNSKQIKKIQRKSTKR